MSLPGADSEADCFGTYFNLMSGCHISAVNLVHSFELTSSPHLSCVFAEVLLMI